MASAANNAHETLGPRVFQYLLDIRESLSCPIEHLIEHGLFKSKDEIFNFVNSTNNLNFCVLKKTNKPATEFLYLIPVIITQFNPKFFLG
jgi:hypothetical protein